MAQKIPLQKGNSAENLKLRLASAVTAKIAAANIHKDGKPTTSSGIRPSGSRSIGYLLQRKQQQGDNSNKLNTKQISLNQKTRLAAGSGKGEETGTTDGEGKTLSSSQDRGRSKLLLSALMSSRQASGTGTSKSDTQTTKQGPTRLLNAAGKTATTNSTRREEGTTIKERNLDVAKKDVTSPPTSPAIAPNTNTDNFSKLLQEIKNKKPPVQNTRPNINGSQDTKSLLKSTNVVPKSVPTVSEKKTLEMKNLTLNLTTDSSPGRKESSNSNAGLSNINSPSTLKTNSGLGLKNNDNSSSNPSGKTFKEKMSTFQSRNLTKSTPDLPTNDTTFDAKEDNNSVFDDAHGKTFQEKRSAFENELRRKQQEMTRSNGIPKTRNGNVVGNFHQTVGNVKFGNAKSGTESFADELTRIQNARKSGNSIGSVRRNSKNGIPNAGNINGRSLSPKNSDNEISNTASLNSSRTSLGSLEDLNKGNEICSNSEVPSRGNINGRSLISPRNSNNSGILNLGIHSKIPPKVSPKPTRGMTSRSNSNISTKSDKFQETVLEKLETDVGSCKIAAFKTMEDFSVLRMRIHRLQGSVEEWKKARER